MIMQNTCCATLIRSALHDVALDVLVHDNMTVVLLITPLHRSTPACANIENCANGGAYSLLAAGKIT